MSGRRLRILYVAYPLLPVSEASAGGAEQMLWTVERQMAARGHETVTAACEGSSVAGELFSTGRAPEQADRFEQRDTEHNARVAEYVWSEQNAGRPFDLIHDKSGHFWKQASAVPVPVLATMHLPRHFYKEEWFQSKQPNLVFNCVSKAQSATFRDLAGFAGVVENGIDLQRFRPGSGDRKHLLWMGRICEEKGAHVAIEVAERAGLPLVMAGQVYPFSYHQEYFKREILPRMERAKVVVEFVERPAFENKLSLLQQAKVLLQPAFMDETSSLVAMEAMACGTPVVAFRRGALPEVVADGVTGFVVDTADEMVDAVRRVSEIDGRTCRQRAETCYSAARMADDYETLYARVLSETVQPRIA